MKRVILCTVLSLCCIMTACSKKPEESQITTTSPSTAVQTTAKPTQPTTAQPTTEAPTAEKPTEPPTDPPTDPPKDTRWKQLYIDFLNTLDDSLYSGYKLVCLDDDDLPELLVKSDSRITPSYICWINGGELRQYNKMIIQFYYYENDNCFLIRSGFPPAGWDEIDRINGNEISVVSHGDTVSLSGQESYKWNDEELGSSSAYESALNNEFTISAAQTADNLDSYAEICKEIMDD